MRHSVLVVDDDADVLKWSRHQLSGVAWAAVDVDAAQGGRAGLARLQNRCYDVLVIDCAGEFDSFALLKHGLRAGRCRSVILLSQTGSLSQAVAAMRAGACNVLGKPLNADEFVQGVQQALGAPPSDDDLAAWRARYAPELIGQDPKILETLRMVQRIANTDCDVLITGASGTGKELVARCIHMSSRRAKNPFVALNCAAIPKDLMESEIFGHTRGAFTGATERRGGKFEAAAGGTLFLDETGEMDLGLQGKFLRVIQEREVTPVGDTRTFRVDVRIVSATNQDLDGLRREKLFREDLYYRLNVVPVHLPSLAERPHDVPILAQHFIDRANRRHGRNVSGLNDAALDAFKAYDWPGNVRELQNLIERIVILKGVDGPVTHDDLPSHMADSTRGDFVTDLRLPAEGLDINEALATVEIRLTLDALERAKGNKAKAAELLGLKRTTLVERLKKLHLEEHQTTL